MNIKVGETEIETDQDFIYTDKRIMWSGIPSDLAVVLEAYAEKMKQEHLKRIGMDVSSK